MQQETEEQEQVFEIEKNEDEAPFLRGQTKTTLALSPVKIVKNPEGTMSRAAMTQGEHHEISKSFPWYSHEIYTMILTQIFIFIFF